MRRAMVIVLALMGASCGRGEPRRPKAIVLVCIDTLRSDRLPVYGYRGIQAPHFDALADDGIVFDRVYSPYPLTLPAHASIFTGLLPPQHGVRENQGYALSGDYKTLAERLSAAGYRTGAFVSSAVLSRSTGIAQGFDEYDDRLGDQAKPRTRVFAQRPGSVTWERARAWLNGLDGSRPFFLFVHFYEPHTPYQAPEPFASRYANPYDAEVAQSDFLVGELVAELKRRGLYDAALLVLLSDHGEGLGDHVEQEHGLFLYRETLQVPLIVKLPRQERRGTRVGAPAGLVDVTPTILALAGTPGEGLTGSALLGPGARTAGRPLYAETSFTVSQYGWSELRSVIANNLHYIKAPRPELFDLSSDSEERRNLLPGTPVPEELSRALSAIGGGKAERRQISRTELEQLAALGYVGGDDRATTETERPDPKDHIGAAMELWEQMRRIGKTDSLQPEMRALELLARLGVRRESTCRSIAINMLRAGRPQAAASALQPFIDSSEPATQVALGEIAAETGRLAEAETRFRKALATDPGEAKAYLGLGILALAKRSIEPARSWLERAADLDPTLADAWNGLGVARAQLGDPAGAIQAWERAVEADPELRDAWYNLAFGYDQRSDRPSALRALEHYAALAQGTERAKAQAQIERWRRS